MNLDEEIKNIAIAEVKSPKLAVTEQFFAVQELDETDPVRFVESVNEKWLVYMGIKEERYYWVVIIEEKSENLVATWGYCNPHSKVYVAIRSLTISPEVITEKLNLIPTHTGKKGETWQGGPRAGVVGRIYEEHIWQYEESLPDASDFDDKLISILNLLLTRESGLKEILNEISILINVAHYVHLEYTWGWHLNKNKFPCSLNLDLS